MDVVGTADVSRHSPVTGSGTALPKRPDRLYFTSRRCFTPPTQPCPTQPCTDIDELCRGRVREKVPKSISKPVCLPATTTGSSSWS